MSIYIKEWCDGTASLLTDEGQYLSSHMNLQAAEQAYLDWYRCSEGAQEAFYDEYPAFDEDGGISDEDINSSTCVVHHLCGLSLEL